jgi:glycogen synthase
VEGGWGLNEVLKSRQHILNGIANGIDMDEWNPETDDFIAAPFNAADLSGAICRSPMALCPVLVDFGSSVCEDSGQPAL